MPIYGNTLNSDAVTENITKVQTILTISTTVSQFSDMILLSVIHKTESTSKN